MVPNRRSGVLVLLLCAVLTLSACGGDDKPKKPAKTTASASPTPTIPPQPKGEQGVTYDVQNWDEIAKDDEKLPVVLGYKRAMELGSASSNRRKIIPGTRDTMTKSGQRQIFPVVRRAWKNRWTLPSTAVGRVSHVRVTGNKASFFACELGKSTSYQKANGTFVVKPKGWSKKKITLLTSGSRWKMDAIKPAGKCSG